MENFDNLNPLYPVFEEFKKTDEFYDLFRKEFAASLASVIQAHYPYLDFDSETEEILRLYANEILSSTESVLYKDKSYPRYRLEEELTLMTRLVIKKPGEGQNSNFIEETHMKAKEIMVKYFGEIMNLSANGFRLLEKNARMYNWEFITNFYAHPGHFN